jgi:hypothetical protein
MSNRRAKFLAKGLCGQCGKANESQFKMCDTCRSNKVSKKDIRAAVGECVECGVDIGTETANHLCFTCAEKRRLANTAWRNTKRKASDDAGLCTRCNKAPADINSKRCAPCKVKVADAARKKRHSISISAISSGVNAE